MVSTRFIVVRFFDDQMEGSTGKRKILEEEEVPLKKKIKPNSSTILLKELSSLSISLAYYVEQENERFRQEIRNILKRPKSEDITEKEIFKFLRELDQFKEKVDEFVEQKVDRLNEIHEFL